MPGDERAGRGADRCSVHPSEASIATCDVCRRTMCLSCTVPVRGGTVGQECLSIALGPDAPPPEAPRR
ncbi:MAG TPA: hypothetical protein VEC15_09075, partial [Actinomycetota bacterium]|nr:hypothetical protein [Actinomycetota bacterium]